MAEIKSINELLNMKLDIPDYQRPYKWDIQNIDDLLSDITNAISDADRYRTDFKYRIGTIILHKTKDDIFDVVDGQQRIISLVLLKQCIEDGFNCTILEKNFANKVTQYNIHRNYTFIREWFSLKSEEAKKEWVKKKIGKWSSGHRRNFRHFWSVWQISLFRIMHLKYFIGLVFVKVSCLP